MWNRNAGKRSAVWNAADSDNTDSMKIAFDGRKAASNRAGLGNYSRFVIRCLATRYPEVDFDVYVAKEKDRTLLSSLKALPNVHICYPEHSRLRFFPLLWTVWGIPAELRKRGADIYHGLANEIPWNMHKVSGVRSIVTIHDLIFLSFPHTYNWLDRHFYNIKFRHSCREADRIQAVSKCTAADIVKYYFTPKQKIDVAYQGCDFTFRQKCSEGFKTLVRQMFSLPSDFILSVGTIEERKNTAMIVKALPELPGLHLVIVGKRTPYVRVVEDTAERLGVSDRVHILNKVGFKELPAIYQMAKVFAYPSRYEGFGIPVLEALCSGVPTIAATGSCLEEAGGDAAIYVDPDDVQGLVDAVDRIMLDKDLRDGMIERGYAHASGFTDDTLAERLMSIYRNLLSDGSGR